jgi:hypothetical protein
MVSIAHFGINSFGVMSNPAQIRKSKDVILMLLTGLSPSQERPGLHLTKDVPVLRADYATLQAPLPGVREAAQAASKFSEEM